MSPLDLIPASFFNKPWHRFKNGSGEEIPAYACMRIEDAIETDNDIVFEVAKPNDEEQPFYLVNGPLAVASGEEAEGRATLLTQGGYILVGGGPVFGDRYGPTDGAWEVTDSGVVLPFLMLGSARSDPTRAAAVQTGLLNVQVATAEISGEMCGDMDEQIGIESFCLVAGGPVNEEPTFAFNRFGRQGSAGARVKIERWNKDPSDNCSAFDHWAITQVQAGKGNIVHEVFWDSETKCIRAVQTLNAAYEACEQPEEVDVLCFEECDPGA